MNRAGKIVSIRSEERAILDLCQKLGISFEIKNTSKSNTEFYKTIILKINKKPYKHLNIVGINSYSNRGRMSMVVNDPSKGRDSFTLFCKGDDLSMKGLLRLNSTEKNNYKRLVVKMRSAGVKTMIYSKRELTPAIAKSYLRTFSLIQISRKDRVKNFEKLAIELEKQMEFLGALGYKDKIRVGAENLIENLKFADIRMSVLSGDNMDNTVNLVNNLKMGVIDFKDTAGFYSMKFKNQREAYSVFSRMMEKIYETMKEINVLDLDDVEKMANQNSVEDYYDMSDDSSHNKKMKTKKLRKSMNDKIKKMKINIFDDLAEEGSRSGQLFKSLLLSGRALDVMLQDPVLISHFKFMLTFAKNIVGYNLSPYHKATIVAFYKEVHKIYVMGVGDGYNDIGMLRNSDVSV